MAVPQPTRTTRWRCALCGNLTRFDVTRSSTVVEFVHLDLAGEPTVEERDVRSESIESVRCRWCDAVDRIELVDRPGAEAKEAPEASGSSGAPGASGAQA